MAKRSPILGYNHNVKYRGLVFHVQTEDSGLMNPHLFTHLFYEGVIISTRKYVYDGGSNEEAIKGLMQAQHKAVMKDLRKGTFDLKIDQYLGGTPGLEPRADGGQAAALPRPDRAPTESAPPPEPEDVGAAIDAALDAASGSPLEILDAGISEPIELPIKARTQTAERTSPRPPPPVEDNAPTLMGSSAGDVAAAIRAANAGLELDLDDDSHRHRVPRDTTVELDRNDGVPVSRTASEDIPALTTPVRQQQQRPASHGAATLPAVKPPSRPIQPVAARPPSKNDDSGRLDADAAERAGQYSVSRKDGGAPIREKTGRIAVLNNSPSPPPNLGPIPGSLRPGQRPSGSPQQPPQPARAAVPNVPREPTPQQTSRPAVAPRPPGVAARPGQSGRTGTPPRGTGTAQRGQVHTAPITNRTPSPSPPQPGSGVVMTRPAVIVGAPPKSPQQPQQRVRKAREEESRGFGQGLISEKSLDEVILAYLSEDAEEK